MRASILPIAAMLPAILAAPQPEHKTATTSTSTGAAAAAITPAVVERAAAAGVGGTKITTLAGNSGVGGATCTVTAFADVKASVAACSNVLLSGLTIPASSTLSVTVPTSGALLFAGTMTVEYTPNAAYTPIVLTGKHAKVAGLAGAVIDGLGAKYWDGGGSNSGTAKPDHLIKLSNMVSSYFGDLTIKNWPTHLFEITGGSDNTIENLILDNSAGNALTGKKKLGHNTDAFDVANVNGLHVKSATVYNQDDCVAVNSGSNIVFENLYCSGGHGMSIGSIKSGVTVSNVTFKDSSVIDSFNGCRIKTISGATGSSVSDITYSNIFLSGISDYAIDVQQDYLNGGPTGKPSSSITVSDVTFKDITGTVSDSDAYEYYLLCGSTSSCTGFTWSGISITGGGKTECSPSGSSICPSF
ncbi:polygalacturonase 3 [Grosmannia clavigera kw1407]|uniref:endo-polygalacturonase n=1 Tax=Grosmannia clavigera (strain kw1407 / UAMH 11150) TaxID=655863 RepID=F0XS41_GROCL|nr:polygalacturonase 3 [Grosmannia clavigera kw1407]EFW99620.1 polygalacturonase 3 [Grosmannia clavigera kw1407]